MPPRLPLPQSTLKKIPEYQRSEAYLHGTPEEDATLRSRGKRRFDQLKEEARRFALTTADPSTQRRKLQKRLIYDFGDLFYEDTNGTIRRKASDQGEVAIPPTLITPAAEPVADVASGRGGVEISLPSTTPPVDTDESLVSHLSYQFSVNPRLLTEMQLRDEEPELNKKPGERYKVASWKRPGWKTGWPTWESKSGLIPWKMTSFSSMFDHIDVIQILNADLSMNLRRMFSSDSVIS